MHPLHTDKQDGCPLQRAHQGFLEGKGGGGGGVWLALMGLLSLLKPSVLPKPSLTSKDIFPRGKGQLELLVCKCWRYFLKKSNFYLFYFPNNGKRGNKKFRVEWTMNHWLTGFLGRLTFEVCYFKNHSKHKLLLSGNSVSLFISLF